MSEIAINNITWEVFHADAKQLARHIKNGGLKYNCILAVSRGGLTLAHVLAIELDIKKVLTICISSYSSKQRTRLKPIYSPGLTDIAIQKRVLLVDDLADSGKSINYINKKYFLANIDTAVLYVKKNCRTNICYKVESGITNWIKFPWEDA